MTARRVRTRRVTLQGRLVEAKATGCAGCVYFEALTSECRERPPLPLPRESFGDGAGRIFPEMDAGDWCALWTPDRGPTDA